MYTGKLSGVQRKSLQKEAQKGLFLCLLVHEPGEQACVCGDKHVQDKEFSLGKKSSGTLEPLDQNAMFFWIAPVRYF